MTEISDMLGMIPLKEIEKKLFELRDFDFITITERGKNLKQEAALQALTAGRHSEILYGGAAGGAKSWTGATFLTFMAECYPGTRWFVGRDSLKSLRESTKMTFEKVFKAYGIEGVKYNAQDHFYEFGNGSRIDFLELKFYPTDELYERFGSMEYTGGWIEEAGEVEFGAFDVLKTRIGRHLNDKYGVAPVLFITCNPKKNWLYYSFFSPWKQGKLKDNRLFIQAFVQDNPAIESGYTTQLDAIEDKSKRERLFLGNWDYDDDPAALCDFDAIVDLFINEHIQMGDRKTAAADLAMQGRDRFVAGSWAGDVCVIKIDQEKSDGPSIENDLREMLINDSIPRTRLVADSDGLGAFLPGYLKGIKAFHGGAQAFKNKVFANLKSECGFKLAELVNKRLIRVICTETQKELIIQELGALKSLDIDKDESRKRIVSKKDMKSLLGRSPDYLDMLIMSMFFKVKPRPAHGVAA